jgi:hypothetical protein
MKREKLRRATPLLVLGAIFNLYCLASLRRSKVRRLPKWAWAMVIMASTPGGGLTYLIFGRDRRSTVEVEAQRVSVAS